MSITIHIQEDLENRLRQRADAEGVHIADYITKMLEAQIPSYTAPLQEQRPVEVELLQKINLGLSPAFWERYAVLKEKRQGEALLPQEQEELIHLSDQIEEANANRMPYLIELAQIRQISLETLFQQLGLQN